MPKFVPKTKRELQELIKDESIYLGDIDTSNITDMSKLFFLIFSVGLRYISWILAVFLAGM